MKFVVVGNLKHNGVQCKQGDVIELSKEAAQDLLQKGVIKPAGAKADPAPAPGMPPAAVTENKADSVKVPVNDVPPTTENAATTETPPAAVTENKQADAK